VLRVYELYCGICLTTEEKTGKKLRVAARSSQTDTVQYKKMKSTIHRRKTVTKSSTMSQNNKVH
jgi:hypothetical protein